jgi:hypothetical protein
MEEKPMPTIAGRVQRTNSLGIGVVANSCSFIPLLFSLDFLSLFHITRTFGNNDVTNFEAKLNEFRDLFGKNVKNAHDRFQDAIAAIDKSIADLQKVKDNLLKSDDHLRLANGKVDDLTIRKLTYKNPTMKAKFDEARDVTDR